MTAPNELGDGGSQHELTASLADESHPERTTGSDSSHIKDEDIVVEFDGDDDPHNPQNWSTFKRIYTTALWALTTSWITFASAIYSVGLAEISEEFDTSYTTANAGTALLIWGFALGPMLWSPLCELYGRKWPALLPYFVSAAFAFGTATGKNIETVLVTRFLAGVFGSSPIAITGGAIVDIWPPKQRGTPMVCYGITIAAAPTLGPIIGGAMISGGLSWRWLEYLMGILMMFQFFVDAFFLSESHADTLLTRKAQKLRKETGNMRLKSKWEMNSPSISSLLSTYLLQPFEMLVDPISFLMTLYGSFVYAILYALLSAFAIEFGEIRHWGPVVSQLPFLAVLVGCFSAAAINIYNNNTYYSRCFVKNNYKPLPEARLPPMMLGSFTFTAGLFIFAWTCSEHVSNPWPSIIGIYLIGLGFTTIFQASLQYIVDTFTRYSASAIAANTFVRSLAAGAFPLFVEPMFHNLGVDWGSTIFALISVLLLPVPFLFFKIGKRVRAKGKWSKISTY
ncbi:MFS general substrate transporter [Aureobasidium pullulans]|nr:MFS general substrate transporter [Aureobasidium pullulans]